MSLALVDAPAVHARFDGLLRLLAKRGRGRTLKDLGDAWTLADALEAPKPGGAVVSAVLERLGLSLADLEGLRCY